MSQKLKLTELQLFRLHESKRHADQVLSEIKRQPLKGEALTAMQALEDASNELNTAVFLLVKAGE